MTMFYLISVKDEIRKFHDGGLRWGYWIFDFDLLIKSKSPL